MNEELTKIIDTLAQKLGVASQFVITELTKWKIANHIAWLIIGSVLLFIAYKIFMVGINKCKEHNKKVDEDYAKKIEYTKERGDRLDYVYKDGYYVYKDGYDDMFQDDEYFVYWAIPIVICVVSLPMIIYGIFVIPWIIAPTGSTMAYLLDVLK
jgi:hypothetical protein